MSDLQAVLCDMDGTLADTEPFWQESKLALAAEHGVRFTVADAEDTVGKSMHYSVERLLHAGVPLEHQQVLDYLVEYVVHRLQSGIPWIPGAQEFLRRMHAAGVPMALVTQAWGPVAREVVAASDGALRAMVSGGDVQHPKPHPQPYLMAAEMLGVDPVRCIAIEDSPSGVESAEAAGCRVIIVPGIHPVATAPTRFPVESIADIDSAMLNRILTA